jgi:predicted DNA-binding transcriptional regulator AlpA
MSTIETASAIVSEPLLITAEDVARLLKLSTRSVWRMKSAGAIPSPIRVGAAVRWRMDEIKKWIEDGCPKRQARENEGLRRH